MEANMGQLLNKITSVQSKSDSVNSSLFEKREHIEKLHRTRNLLRKVQFIYDLPVRLNKCIKAEAYTDAVRFFTGAKPIFGAYGDSSFQDCKRASEEAMELVKQNLQKKLYSDNEPIESRAEVVVLLKQLNFPVGGIWEDVTVMDEVLSEAALPVYSLEAVSAIIKQYISGFFFADCLGEQQIMCDSRKHGDLLLEFRQLLTDDLELVKKLRDLMIDRVQEGFHSFFQKLNQQFHLLCGKSNTTYQDTNTSPMHIEKVHTGLVLVLAQLSAFIEQTAIPRITEEIAASFSAGGSRGYENGPAFVPGEACRLFHSSGDKFLHLYINLRTQKISAILKKRFTTPNWIKLEGMESEVKQILPHGAIHRHHRSDSAGSTTTSRSNPLREDKLHRSNTQRARSQLLKATWQSYLSSKWRFLQKLNIRKLYGTIILSTGMYHLLYLQESVISTAVKLCVKSLQEFVRLQTFNRSGYQQIKLDIEYQKNPLKEFVDDDAAIDFLLKEVHNAAHERCLDPIPLELPIVDKLINAKLARRREQQSSPR